MEQTTNGFYTVKPLRKVPKVGSKGQPDVPPQKKPPWCAGHFQLPTLEKQQM